MRADPELAAVALLALLDPNADEEDRLDGALVIASMVQDIHMLRRAYVTSR